MWVDVVGLEIWDVAVEACEVDGRETPESGNTQKGEYPGSQEVEFAVALGLDGISVLGLRDQLGVVCLRLCVGMDRCLCFRAFSGREFPHGKSSRLDRG